MLEQSVFRSGFDKEECLDSDSVVDSQRGTGIIVDVQAERSVRPPTVNFTRSNVSIRDERADGDRRNSGGESGGRSARRAGSNGRSRHDRGSKCPLLKFPWEPYQSSDAWTGVVRQTAMAQRRTRRRDQHVPWKDAMVPS